MTVKGFNLESGLHPETSSIQQEVSSSDRSPSVYPVAYHCPIPPTVLRWDGESVVFHPGSSNTFFFDEFTTIIIEQLSDGPRTLAQLRQFISASYELEDGASLEPALRQKLNELTRLDFVETQQPCN